MPIAGISEPQSSGQVSGEFATEALHAEQRGLEFVRCHGVGAVVCAVEVYRVFGRLNRLLRLLTLQENLRSLRACP